VLVPADTPVTTPVLFTVATAVLLLDHGVVVAAVAVPVKVVVPPTHTFNVPVIVGNGLTVNVVVAWHPLTSVYVIVVVPADTPVTTPVLLIVATPVLLLVHGVVAFGVPLAVSVLVLFKHTFNVPLMIGNGFTVTVAVV
jgi:hypothetical protein